jgi:hypothetical protein
VIVPLACTGTGVSVFVTDKAAKLATCTLAEAVLLPLLGSLVLELIEAVSAIVVPAVAVVGTLTTKAKVAVPLAARLAMVHLYGTVLVHVHPDPLVSVSEEKVVPVGKVSASTTVVAAAGPLLVTVWEYVMLLPADTGFGVPVFVTLRSACVPLATPIVTVAELFVLFVSVEVVATVAVSVMMVPAVVPEFTVTW